MASTSTKWIAGCGIGCLVIILLLAGIAGGGFLCVRGMVRNFQVLEESRNELVDAFGSVTDYSPSSDGSIDETRIRNFVSIRRALQPYQGRLDKAFDRFSRIEEVNDRSPIRILESIRNATSVIPAITSYIHARNTILLDHAMGIGEYIYLYMIIYHSWLGHKPDDHPDITHIIRDINSDDESARNFESNFDPEEIMYRYRTMAVGFLRNQIHAVESSGLIQDPDWISALDNEVNLLSSGTHNLLWQNGLPPRMLSCLEPHRAVLEQTYSTISNVFDLFFNDFEHDTRETMTYRL